MSDNPDSEFTDIPRSEYTRLGGFAVADRAGTSSNAGALEKRVVQVGGHDRLKKRT